MSAKNTFANDDFGSQHEDNTESVEEFLVALEMVQEIYKDEPESLIRAESMLKEEFGFD